MQIGTMGRRGGMGAGGHGKEQRVIFRRAIKSKKNKGGLGRKGEWKKRHTLKFSCF
jgi:hypothetical protein